MSVILAGDGGEDGTHGFLLFYFLSLLLIIQDTTPTAAAPKIRPGTKPPLPLLLLPSPLLLPNASVGKNSNSNAVKNLTIYHFLLRTVHAQTTLMIVSSPFHIIKHGNTEHDADKYEYQNIYVSQHRYTPCQTQTTQSLLAKKV